VPDLFILASNLENSIFKAFFILLQVDMRQKHY